MTGRAARWMACTAGVAVVTGVVVFLSLQSLADADSWSSIGGFLTALITVVVSVAGWVFRRAPAEAPAPRRRGWTALNWGNQVVINGDNTENRVDLRND